MFVSGCGFLLAFRLGSVCFSSFAFCCLMYTFYAEATQETTEAVRSELLTEAVSESLSRDPVLFAEAIQPSSRSCSSVPWCLPVSTVLDFKTWDFNSLMFISLFWI